MPPDFPLAWADRLREERMELRVDADAFDLRRRVKTDAQLAGIRRAQVAADAAMAAAAALVRELPGGLTCERVREEMQRVCAEHDAELPETAIVAHGAQSAVGHEEGSGPIERGEVVLIDIWPRDKASRCWADMTRTFVAGGEAPPAELQEYWELTRASLDAGDGGDPPRRGLPRAARALLRAVRGRGQADGAHEGAGHRAGRGLLPRPRARGRARGPRAPEPRPLRRAADRRRRRDGRAGLLPARASGACRLEDLLLVTEDGCEVLTDFPYELSP